MAAKYATAVSSQQMAITVILQQINDQLNMANAKKL